MPRLIVELVAAISKVSRYVVPFSRPALNAFSWLFVQLQRFLRRCWVRLQVWRRRSAHWLLFPAVIPALLVVYRIAPVFWNRMRLEMDVEWTEGGGLYQAYRVMHGQPLYPPPQSGFMPYPYPPLHTWILAFFGKIFGLSFSEGRAVSLAAVGLAAFLLAREVTREWRFARGAYVFGVLTLGLILVGYPIAGTYFDLIRTDSLALAMSVASCVAVLSFDEKPKRRQFWICVALFLAAILSKQVTMFYIAWLLLFLFTRRPRLAVAMGAVFLVLGLGVHYAIHWSSNGGFLHYTYFNLSKHEIRKDHLEGGATSLLAFAPYVWLTPVAFLALLWRRHLSRRALVWFGMFVMTIPAGLLPYAKIGGYFNNFVPIVFLMGPAALCLAGAALAHPRAGRQVRNSPATVILAYSVAFYTYQRSFEVKDLDVSEERSQSAKALRQFARKLGTNTLSPGYPYLAIQGHSTLEQSDPMPWFDAMWSGVKNVSFGEYFDRVKPEYTLLSGAEYGVVLGPISDKLTLDSVCEACTVNQTLYGGMALPKLAFVRIRKRKNPHCIFDFESGLDGWTLSGQGFYVHRRSWSGEYIGAEGNHFLYSYWQNQDPARGSALSPPFTIDQPKLSLRIGGGKAPAQRVELVIDDRVVRSDGGLGGLGLKDYVWDVRGFKGQTARIRAVDDGTEGWGNTILDSVCLED